MSPHPSLLLEIVSDTICPWCYIGKRRLEGAIALLKDELTIGITWRPFELNPDMPSAGITRRDYRINKFGSWEHSLRLDARVAEAGTSEGIEFHHERMQRTPNTIASHMLIHGAGSATIQDQLVESLFHAYFVAGRDIGEIDVLVDIAGHCGIDEAQTRTTLNDEELEMHVRAEAQANSRSGINGVPSGVLNGTVLFSGAQPPLMLADTLRAAAEDHSVTMASEQTFS